jgi:hypothetical protein
MGMMITTQRSGVTATRHMLESAGLIRWSRSLVTLRNRAKLKELAGDACGAAEARRRTLIGHFEKPAAQG